MADQLLDKFQTNRRQSKQEKKMKREKGIQVVKRQLDLLLRGKEEGDEMESESEEPEQPEEPKVIQVANPKTRNEDAIKI